MAQKKAVKNTKDFPGKWLVKHLIAALVVVVVLVIGAAMFLEIATKHGEELIVPDLSNMSVQEAQEIAAASD